MSKITRAIEELAKRAAQGDVKAAEGIKLFHGSPYDFPPVRELEMPDGAVVYQHMDDAVPEGASVIKEYPLGRFDMSKIGTGEGAQAYSRGLYFAEREATGQSYREALSGKNASFEDGSFVPEWVLTAQKNGKLKEAKLDFQDRVKQINEMMDRSERPHLLKEQLDTNAKILQGIERLEGGDIPKVGRMYEVNIDATPDEFIDWDLPLDEQSESVMNALKKTDWYQYAEEGAYNAAERRGDNAYGMDLVRWLEEDGAEDAAQMLKDAGIKGVQYADAQTRFGKGPKTKNYVVYDDRLVDITKKYGISIPLATAVLAGSMTPEEAQAGPLSAGALRIIDPRFSGPVGSGSTRKGVLSDLEGVETTVDPRLMNIGRSEALYDYEGSPYILTQSDRSAAGGVVTSVKGKEIDPVNLRGGRDFMFDPQSGDLVWASDPAVVKSMYKRALELRELYGKDPLLLPYTMAPTGIDFATMPLDVMINYARQGMGRSDIKRLDEQIRKVIPSWKGVMNPEANAVFREVHGNKRKAVANIIDKNFRDVEGGLSMGEARAATSDAAQYMAPDGSIQNIGQIEISDSSSMGQLSDHPTYRGGLKGQGIGKLDVDIDARELMEDKGRELTGDAADIRALSMNHELSQGVVDEKLLRRLYDKQRPRIEEISKKFGVSIPIATMALMGEPEEAQAGQGGGLVPFDPAIHTPQDVGLGEPGSVSTEYIATVDAPDGSVMLIPTIWWDAEGNPKLFKREDTDKAIELAIDYEKSTGKQFPRFPAGAYAEADDYAISRSKAGGASQTPLARDTTTGMGGMGVQSAPVAQDEEALIAAQQPAPTAADLMQQANDDFLGSIVNEPGYDSLAGMEQMLMSGIMKTAGIADLSADFASAMVGPVLSAPGAVARYAAGSTADEIAQARKETEDYFNYQPRTELGPQYGEQAMQAIGGVVGPYVPAIKEAADESYILGAMKKGYNYLGDREKELAKALGDLSPY